MGKQRKRRSKKGHVSCGPIKKKSAHRSVRSRDLGQQLRQAVSCHRSGNTDEAESIYRSILKVNPNHPDALHLLGIIATQKGELPSAIRLIQKAIRQYPESDVFHNNLGNALAKANRTDEAIQAYREALRIKPDSVDAMNNLATHLKASGQAEQALDYFERALLINPQAVEVYNNMGNALTDLGRIDAAIERFRKAVALDPNDAVAHNNLACALKRCNRFKEAVESYGRAINADPGYAEAFNNLGETLAEMGHPDEAIPLFNRAIALKADFELATGNLVYALNRNCGWQQSAAIEAQLDRYTQLALDAGRRPPEDPFLNLSRHDDPALNSAVARAWSKEVGRRMAGVGTPFDFQDRRSAGGKITLGYLSGNFRDHALGYLVAGMLECHDRQQFNIYSYSTGINDESQIRRRIEQASDRFVDICRSDHLAASRRIYEDRVDILIDLMGYTKGGRMEIAALRPAPVQVRYMGMAGTTGADFFDYLIADRTVVPEADARYYSEKLVYLPDCYQINDDRQQVPALPYRRSMMGLPSEGIVFCSFNQHFKIDPVMFRVWMQILQRVPESVLWLLNGAPAAIKNLRRAAAEFDVASERLIFGQRLSKKEHLARLRLADIALDTRIVNGAATTSDALLAGVPVVTMAGRHFSSRMSASILTAFGLPELIAENTTAYRELAIQLAMHPDQLRVIGSKLRRKQDANHLFDTARTTSKIEWGYQSMWRDYCSRDHKGTVIIPD